MTQRLILIYISRGKAVGEKEKLLYRNIQGLGSKNTTVLACAFAAEELLPHLIVFQAAKLLTTWKGRNDLPNTFFLLMFYKRVDDC